MTDPLPDPGPRVVELRATRRRPTVTTTPVAACRTTVLRLAGEFDSAARPLLHLALVRAGSEGDTVVVDLRDITFLDSSTLGLLVSARRRATQEGRLLVLTDPPPRVLRLLRITGLTGLLDLRPDLAPARPAGVVAASPSPAPAPRARAALWAGRLHGVRPR